MNSTIGTITDYLSGIQYTNGAIEFIQTEEGRALNNAGTYSYQYNLTDHLGNVRYSFDIYGGAVRKLQEDDYYAFGKRYAVTGGNNNYLYNGKELQDELGQYDYGARFYDPVVGRWNVVDPLAEKMRRYSPYNYVFNNPIRFVDPDGMEANDWVKTGNIWSWDSNVTSAEQATAAGYDGYAAPGTIVSGAKIGADGPVGNVYLGGDASDVGYTLNAVTVANSTNEESSFVKWFRRQQSQDYTIGSGYYLTYSGNKTGEDSDVKFKPKALGKIDHIELNDILNIAGAVNSNPFNFVDHIAAINNVSGGEVEELTTKKEKWFVDPIKKDTIPESEAIKRQIKRFGEQNWSNFIHLGYLK